MVMFNVERRPARPLGRREFCCIVEGGGNWKRRRGGQVARENAEPARPRPLASTTKHFEPHVCDRSIKLLIFSLPLTLRRRSYPEETHDR